MKLIKSLSIPLLVGIIAALITRNGMNIYKFLEKPILSPPAIIFPIVWTILYILMGISYYIISNKKSISKEESLFVYYLQLLFNFIWSLVFFLFNMRFLSIIIIIILLVLIFVMIFKFYKIDKLSSYLQIPYLLWVSFATYLNIMIYILNK